MGKIKIDPADKVFSQYIRLRDKYCQRCFSPVKFNAQGLPVSHETSHFHGRGKEPTRFDEENCVCLCYGCHQYFTSHPQEHRDWQLKRLGRKTFDALQIRANTYQKKDRKLAKIYWTQRLKELTSKQ